MPPQFKILNMPKELPYFKFEPAEYLAKDISFCSFEVQGFFISLCAYYWQRNCKISREQVIKRLKNEEILNELIHQGIIDVNNEQISIKFLDKQLVEVEKLSQKNAVNGAKGGRPKNPKETQKKPTALFWQTQTKAIREDKIREDKIREDKNIECVFSFKKSLLDLGVEKQNVIDWMEARKKKKAANTLTALNGFLQEVAKSKLSVNEAVKICGEKSWAGFKSEWLIEEIKQKKNEKGNTGFDEAISNW